MVRNDYPIVESLPGESKKEERIERRILHLIYDKREREREAKFASTITNKQP